MATYKEGSIVYEVSLDTKNLLENSGKVREQMLKLNDNGELAAKGLNKVEASASSAGNSLGKLTTIAKAVSAALISSQILAYAQSWNELEDRIGNTGATAEQTKDIMDQLLETSNRNGRTIEESSELYIRLSNSMKELGYSTNGTLSYIDTLSNLMTINKTNALAAQSATNALTKAQMAGKLAGENANSVFNAMPSILKTLGTQLKKTETEVRQMASDGKLSMKIFSDAMISAQNETATFADNMRNTVNDGVTRVTNNLKQYLGELNNSTGATKLLVDSLVLMSQHVDVLVNGLGVLAAIYAGKYVTSLAAATKQSAEKVITDIKQATSEKAAAQSALQQAQAELANRVAAQKSMVAQLELAQTERTRSAIRGQLKANTIALTAATNAEAAAQARLNAALKASSFAANGLKSAMNMLGGPAGILLIAAGAFISWSSNADQARKSATELTINIDELTNAYKKMNQEQREAEKVKLNNKIATQMEEIAKIQKDITKVQEKGTGSSGLAAYNDKLYKEKTKEITLLKGQLADANDVLAQLQVQMDNYSKVENQVIESTSNLVGETDNLNSSLSKSSVDNITKNIAKLAQETEIASLKQNKLNKEAYVYQNILSILGDDAKKYQASILKAAQTGELFKSNIQGLPSEVYPLISALSELYDINNDGSIKTNNAASKIKELKDNIAVARLEVQGVIKDAKELEALQNAKATGGNQDEINQIIALTKEYEKLELAKAGKSFAQEQVNNGLSDLDKITLDEQAKLTKLNEWRETGLASEQLYQDSLTAITEDAAKQRKKIDDDAAAAKQSSMTALLSSTSAVFGGMADIIGEFSSESSAAYKTAFALSKGFAIASATLNLQSALMQVMADQTALTPAQKFANYAAVASAGGGILSQISSISFGGGREHGGAVSGDSMYRVGEGGKPEILMAGGRQYMIPGENGKVISNKDIKATSTSGINVVINNYGNDSVETRQSGDNNQIIIDIAAKKGAEMGYQKVTESISSHSGGLWTALTQNTNTKAKL